MPRKFKVLTLGWEFPPLYAGGLGPACYGLTKALNKYVENTIILPRSEKSFTVNRVQIIGLNHIASQMKKDTTGSSVISEINWNKESFSAYPLAVNQHSGKYDLNEKSEALISVEDRNKLFSEEDIYGFNIMKKVEAYGQMVCDLAKQIDFDIIHAHDWITYTAAVRLKHQTGKPMVVHVHSLETDRVNKYSRNAVYKIEQAGMKEADRVFPVSNFTKQCIIDYYGIDEEKISAVYNGYDADFNMKKKARRQNVKKEKRVLFLGRITAQKGPEYLIETAQKLLNRMSNVKISIAGTGDMKLHVAHLIEKNNLKDKIVFTGFLNKEGVKKLLSETDAYIMPSVSEPFGLSAIEAAQYNIPCVISKQSGAAEVMPNTLQANYWDTDRMANYLFATLNYKSLSDTLTEKTKINLKNINWEVAAKKVLRNYKNILN
jgi:glycogen synthase